MKRPHLYFRNAHKIYKPKIEYFKTLGVSEVQIAKMLTAVPFIFERSLEKQIIPCIQFLKQLLGTNENVLKAMRAGYRLVEVNVERELERSISTLVNHGVSQSLVLKMLLIQPKPLLLRRYRFSEAVGEIKKLGFDTTKLLFILAIRYSAFKKQPMCMLLSEMKIRKLMGFYVKKLSMEPSFISKNPTLLLFSLEKRITSRCSVLELLILKDLIKGGLSLVNVLRINEKMFLEKFVEKYWHKLPEVVKAYQGNIKFQGFSFDIKDGWL